MKFINFIFFTFFCLAVFSSTFGQQRSTERFAYIKELTQAKRFSEAEDEIQKQMISTPTDPTLVLYRTEIWIETGNLNYASGKLKTAFEYYSRAYPFWPSHPVLRERYLELKNKPQLSDAADVEVNPAQRMNAGGNGTVSFVYLGPPGLTDAIQTALKDWHNVAEKMQSQENLGNGSSGIPTTDEVKKINERMNYFEWRLNGIIAGLVILVILQLFTILKNRR